MFGRVTRSHGVAAYSASPRHTPPHLPGRTTLARGRGRGSCSLPSPLCSTSLWYPGMDARLLTTRGAVLSPYTRTTILFRACTLPAHAIALAEHTLPHRRAPRTPPCGRTGFTTYARSASPAVHAHTAAHTLPLERRCKHTTLLASLHLQRATAPRADTRCDAKRYAPRTTLAGRAPFARLLLSWRHYQTARSLFYRANIAHYLLPTLHPTCHLPGVDACPHT